VVQLSHLLGAPCDSFVELATSTQEPRKLGLEAVETRGSVQEAIVANCGTHSMPGCDSCTGTGAGCPDTLSSLQSVCQAHRMEMCAPYNSMCTANGEALSHFCTNRGGAFDPPMRMYFHKGVPSHLGESSARARAGHGVGCGSVTLVQHPCTTACALVAGRRDK
jgi:hypothetical protein